MSVIRKHGKKFQVLIRRKDSPHIIKSFVSKEAAREWARETEVNIERGFYANSSYAQRMTLGQLLTEYRDIVSEKRKVIELKCTGSVKFLGIKFVSVRYLNLLNLSC